MKRTFIGLKVDTTPGLLNLISDLKENLDGEQLRWIDPQNFHLTLRFLGNTEDSQLIGICKELELLVPQFPVFNLDIEGIGLFGKQSAPKVLWAGVKVPEIVYDLAGRIEKIVCNAGFPGETKPFNPHLTLCRIKSLTNTAHLLNLVNRYKQTHFHTQKVNQIIFYESILKNSGPVYMPVKVFELV